MIEDAEDGDTDGWEVFDNDPPGIPVNTVDPEDDTNRVIELQHYQTGYRYVLPRMQKRGSIVQWRMFFRTNWYMYVNCMTDKGAISIRYTPSTVNSNLGDDPVIGLGIPSALDEWTIVRRNLVADLRTLHPEIELEGVTGIMARGDGYLDDVYLYDYRDDDCDILPDEYEEQHGLDPKDPTDAKERAIKRMIAASPCNDRATDRLDDSVPDESVADEEEKDDGEDKKREKKDVVPKQEKRNQRPKDRSSDLTREEKQRLREELKKRYTEYLEKLEPPEPGSRCAFRLRSGTAISGVLRKTTDAAVYVETAHGTASFRIDEIHPDDAETYSVKLKARNLALADLDELKENIIKQRLGDERAQAGGDASSDWMLGEDNPWRKAAEKDDNRVASAPVLSAEGEHGVSTGDGIVRYDPSRAQTPVALQPTLAMFGGWLVGYQADRDIRVADRVSAKRSADAAVLYITCSPAFMVKTPGFRLKTVRVLREKWCECCEKLGTADSDGAHVVLIDDTERIIGGSQPTSPEDVWVLPQ